MLFILNIFLMLQAQFGSDQKGLEVDLPKATTGGALPYGVARITVDRQNRVFLGTEGISMEALRKRLSEFDRDTPVILCADRASSYGTAIAVFDLLRELSFPKVSLMAYQKPGEEPKSLR